MMANETIEIHDIMEAVQRELVRAMDNFPSFNSAHEGYSVILEELDELWEHVKANQKNRDWAEMQKEAIQVAAMAIRFAIDVHPLNRN